MAVIVGEIGIIRKIEGDTCIMYEEKSTYRMHIKTHVIDSCCDFPLKEKNLVLGYFLITQ